MWAGPDERQGGCACTAPPLLSWALAPLPTLPPPLPTLPPPPPPRLLCQVDNNRFGAQRLPDEWGESALEYLGLGGNPLLEGPAFPPAWLEPGRMSSLRFLRLSNNGRLGGALPANLSWPVLEEL